MKYRITGADRATGADRIVSVEADDEVHAVALAREQGGFTYRVELVHDLGPAADLPEETRGHNHSKRKSEQRVASVVLLVILGCGIWIGLIREPSNSPPVVSNRDTGHDDPRDRRFDSPDGREVVRAIAEQAGVSDREARKSLNDEIDRRGLSDWAGAVSLVRRFRRRFVGDVGESGGEFGSGSDYKSGRQQHTRHSRGR